MTNFLNRLFAIMLDKHDFLQPYDLKVLKMKTSEENRANSFNLPMTFLQAFVLKKVKLTIFLLH